ncbi:hypothetical protein DP939_15955 [Spongiactinospora rosea]|uniref:Uncharacterized protein n=1 Tax=Spongiactinospora rosea TaxID=2248750 RepID=A0A366M0T4_9ACTN|nr:hypothetical protein [Spongiactinospora rosea]RBQ19410.1 hypothetical protein DP939_15955 [Spongiactinospora rosea]
MRAVPRTLAGVAALAAVATAGVIYYHGRDPGPEPTAQSERTSSIYNLAGDRVAVETDGQVRISVVTRGATRQVNVARTLQWTGQRHHEESWKDDRLRVSFDCDQDCSAAYVVEVPDGTQVTVNGTPA